MPGPRKQPLPAKGHKFALLSAQGYERRDLLREVFGITDLEADPEAVNRADVQMSRWRRHPEFDKVFAEEVKLTIKGISGRAAKVLANQLNKEEVPWLQNKAANDVLTMVKASLFGDDERTINVRVEGMPEIGSPDQDEKTEE